MTPKGDEAAEEDRERQISAPSLFHWYEGKALAFPLQVIFRSKRFFGFLLQSPMGVRCVGTFCYYFLGVDKFSFVAGSSLEGEISHASMEEAGSFVREKEGDKKGRNPALFLVLPPAKRD